MEIICTFWIILCLGTSFAQMDDDVRKILSLLQAAKENETQTGFRRNFNWTVYTAPPLPFIPTFIPPFDFKDMPPPSIPEFTEYNTEYRDRKYGRKSMKLGIKVAVGFAGLIIAGLLWLCKKKSNTDQTSNDESSLVSPDSLPKAIPLPYSPLPSAPRLPQQSPPCPQQEDPNLQPPNLAPLSLRSIRVITKNETGCPEVALISASTPGSPKLRSLIIVHKVPQESPKD